MQPEMRCHFFQWIDGPEMYDRAFIQQKYMLNYSVRAENFSRWKPYVPDEEGPKDPSKLPSVIHIDDKGKAHAAEHGRHSVSGALAGVSATVGIGKSSLPAGSDFIAGLVGVGFRAVITQALNFEVRRFCGVRA